MTESASTPTAQVVVVDDSGAIRLLLTRALEQAGFRVSAAADGEEGVTRIRELAPALVVVDAQMPGKDGHQLCREVREDTQLGRQPKIIMLTAAGEEADRRRAQEAGVDEFLTKPFDPAELVERARETLGGS
jgi:DNA-binding response OmpR family regulator